MGFVGFMILGFYILLLREQNFAVYLRPFWYLASSEEAWETPQYMLRQLGEKKARKVVPKE